MPQDHQVCNEYLYGNWCSSNTSLQLSAKLGVAVLGTVATEHTRALAAPGERGLEAGAA
jgi:hypothetical protein